VYEYYCLTMQQHCCNDTQPTKKVRISLNSQKVDKAIKYSYSQLQSLKKCKKIFRVISAEAEHENWI
jgi:hypothetical protein